MWEYIEESEFSLPQVEFVETLGIQVACYNFKSDNPNLMIVHGMGGCVYLNSPLLNCLS